ncbi:MAG: TrpR-related protein YerC/YecD [Clostridia bacterium]|nr:TrpR-related protein YerC/YecD [Clostridia bacterium]
MSDTINVDELYEIILKLKTVDDCRALFNDLCTYKEIDSMAQRIVAAKLLLNNETYEEIIKQTNISSATLSRVSKCVKYGEGYKKFLK